MSTRKLISLCTVVVLVGIGLVAALGVAFAAGRHSVNLGFASIADGDYSTVGGGAGNSASGRLSVVAGGGNPGAIKDNEGEGNSASGDLSVVGGGWDNAAGAQAASILGGSGNRALGEGSSVLGGIRNSTRGENAVAAGGSDNGASGDNSFAAGQQAAAIHDGAFVWSGEGGAQSERDNEFVVQATGGVRLVTDGAGLTLDGQDVMAYIRSLEARIADLESGRFPSVSISLAVGDGQIGSAFRLVSDESAPGGEYITPTSNSPTRSPRERASWLFSVEQEGDYYLWAQLYGPDANRDAIYIGVDGSWTRAYPASMGEWLWARVETCRSGCSGKYAFSLDEGNHRIKAGPAEPGARLAGFWVTNDPDAQP